MLSPRDWNALFTSRRHGAKKRTFGEKQKLANYPHIKSFKKNEKKKAERSEISDKRVRPFCGNFVRYCLQRNWNI